MEEKVLTSDELQNVTFRNGLINQKKLELQIIQRELEIYQKGLLEKYGLDTKKEYKIDNRGVITEHEQDNRPDKV